MILSKQMRKFTLLSTREIRTRAKFKFEVYDFTNHLFKFTECEYTMIAILTVTSPIVINVPTIG